MTDREAQIRELLPAVKRIAKRMHRLVGGSDLDDLIGDGSVGLIRAVDSFNPSYGMPLAKYARRIIVGAMLNGIRRLDPVSERVRRTLREAERERYALANERGSLPSATEMEARIPGLARARAEAYRGTALSLDAPLAFGEPFEIAGTTGDPQATLTKQADRVRMQSAIARLPHRQRRLIVAHYFADRPLRILSEELNISAQRASQLHLSAIMRLRHDLHVPR
jgi:RNA polymerase sigma factor for flagellar operon FliA